MTSPTLELSGAIVARLKSYAPLTALIGARVYDDVPTVATFPYVSLGPTFEVPDNSDCVDGSEISVQIDAWSRAVGAPEVLRIAEAVRMAMRGFSPSLADNALVLLEHRRTQRVRDPDGATNHAILEFLAVIEQP